MNGIVNQVPFTRQKTINCGAHVESSDLGFICSRLVYEMEAMRGKTLFISGVAGFLGHYLVKTILHWNTAIKKFKDLPIEIIASDNFLRGVPEWLQNLKNHASFTLIKHDITCEVPVEYGYFDYVIHAASIASPTYYRRYPIETMDANVSGLRLLLERCRKQQAIGHPVSGFLYFSTSEIYGDPSADHIPTSETYRGNVSCTGPRACYDESKRFGETLCVNFAKQFSLPVTSVRPFNNYGPGLKISDRRVIPDFARDLFSRNDLVLLSNGNPTRTFCYVSDAIAGYFKVLVRGRAGEAYNIGCETPEISMLGLANLLVATAKDLFGYDGKVRFNTSAELDYLTDNPQRRCPSIEKARIELDFDPQVTIEEGMRRTLIWYQDNQQAGDS